MSTLTSRTRPQSRPRTGRRNKRVRTPWFSYIVVAAGGVAMALPFFDMVSSSFKGSGEYGIIPGSMGTSSYIVKGLGNEAAFNSASHGAGRRMSRNAAKRRFTVRDLEEQTRGVECRKDSGVLDEIPGAYKNIDQVMAQQSDLVEVVAKLKQFVCVKG